MVQVHNGERRDGCSYLVRLPGADGWHRAEFCNGHWAWGRNAIRASDIMEWFGPLLDDEPALPRSFDRVDEAALVEQGMTPGMVVGDTRLPTWAMAPKPMTVQDFMVEADADMARIRDLARGIVARRAASDLPINPEPQQGELYWVWCRNAQEHWQPARFLNGHWAVIGHGIPWGRAGVKFWRGPMTPPEAPTPAQVDAALGRKRVVHEVHDLEASG